MIVYVKEDIPLIVTVAFPFCDRHNSITSIIHSNSTGLSNVHRDQLIHYYKSLNNKLNSLHLPISANFWENVFLCVVDILINRQPVA